MTEFASGTGLGLFVFPSALAFSTANSRRYWSEIGVGYFDRC